MTDKMKDFVEKLEKARKGEDEGLSTLKSIGLKLKNVVSKRYGGVYLTFTQVLSLGKLSFEKGMVSTLYCSDDNKLYYVQKVKFNGINQDVQKSILDAPFEICIMHNMDRVNIGNFNEFEVLVEKSIDIFIVTKYGVFDVYNTINTNISIETAIEDSFKKENIVLYPSSKSIFAKDLNKEIYKNISNQDTLVSNGKSKVSLGYALYGNTCFDPDIKYLSCAYINGKYFSEFECNYFNEANIIVRGDLPKDIVFTSKISIYGLKTKISSELLAKKNKWSIIEDNVNVQNIPKFNATLLKNVYFYTVKRGIDDIKYKYHTDLICSMNEKRIKDVIKEQFINYRLTFKERIGSQFVFGKLLFLNSEFVDNSNDKYDVSLYNQYIIYCGNRIYKVNEILVENKQTGNVFIVSLLERGAQIRIIKDNILLPLLYFIPCNVIMGTEINCYIQDGLSDKLVLDGRIKKYIYDKIIEEFGNVYASDNILKECYKGLFITKINKSLDKMQNIEISLDLENDIIQFMQDII